MTRPLTWRDVAAPDFSTAMQGYGRFSELLSGAFSNLDKGLTRFDNAQSDAVNKEAMMRVMAQSDAGKLEAGLQDGSLLGDLSKRRLSVDTLKSADQRIGNLLERDSMEQRVAQDKYNFTNLVDRDTARAAATPAVMQLFSEAANGNKDAMARIKADPALSKLKYDDLVNLNRDVQGAYSTGLSDKATIQNTAQGATRFDREGTEWNQKQTEYAEGRAADELFLSAKGAAQGDGAMFEDYIRGSDASPHVKYAALKRAGLDGGMSAPGAGGGGAAGGGVGSVGSFTHNADRREVASTLGSGGIPPVVIAGALGNFEVEGGYDGALGDGETASGIAQWRKERRDAFRKRNGGVDPHKASKKAQAEHVVWELTTPEGRASAGISAAQAQLVLSSKTPEEAAENFMNVFERPNKNPNINHVARRKASAAAAYQTMFGKSPADVTLQAAANQDVLADQSARSANNYNTRMLEAGLKTNTSPVEAAANAAKKPVFAGVPAGELLGEMHSIMQKTSIGGKQGANQEQALLILENSLRPASGIGERLASKYAFRIDDDLLQKNIKEFGSGKYLDARDANRQRSTTSAEVGALASRRNALMERIQRYERASQIDKNPAIAETLVNLTKELAYVDSQIGAVGQKVNGPDPAALLVNTTMGAVANMTRGGNRPAPPKPKQVPVERRWENALTSRPLPQSQQGWDITTPPLLKRR